MPGATRRTLLGSATSLAAAGVFAGSLQNTSSVAQSVAGRSQYGVKALFFDVFGTLVDWRTGIAREAESHLKSRGYPRLRQGTDRRRDPLWLESLGRAHPFPR